VKINEELIRKSVGKTFKHHTDERYLYKIIEVTDTKAHIIWKLRGEKDFAESPRPGYPFKDVIKYFNDKIWILTKPPCENCLKD
jgi:hypothetical protein